MIPILCVVLTIAIIVARYFRSSDEYMPPKWIKRQRSEHQEFFTGVSWKWPINKRVNEAAKFNTAREKMRKRA